MDDNRVIASATIKGTAWNYLIFGLSKGVTFVATVILARLLSPDEIGLMAIGLIVIGYLDTFSGLGVENVIIYRQDDVEHNSNVAFTLSLGFNILISVAAFFIAPLAANFFNDARLTDILRALSVIFIIWGLGNIHAARLKKELKFRQTLLPELGKSASKAIVSISLALAGFGVWSLVWGQIAANITVSVLYWIIYRWRPRLTLDIPTSRRLLGYSVQTVISELMGTIQNNIDYLIVGKRLGSNDLGFYTMAFRVPELLIINMCYIVSNALFPAYSKLQNDLDALRKGCLVTLRYVALFTVPVGFGLFLVTPEIVRVIFGEQWIPAIPVMQAISLYSVIYSLSFNAGDIYKAIGRPDLMNILGVFKLAVAIPILWLAGGFSIFTVSLSQIAIVTFLTLVRFFVIKHLISLHWRDIFSAIWPAVTGASVMFLGVYILQASLGETTALTRLVVLPLIGGLIYLMTIWFAHREIAQKAIELLASTFLTRTHLERS